MPVKGMAPHTDPILISACTPIQTPMPKEALLHPQDEDYPVESNAHDKQRTYLRYTLEERLPRGWIEQDVQLYVFMSCADWFEYRSCCSAPRQIWRICVGLSAGFWSVV